MAILVHGQLIVSSKAIFTGVDNSDPNASGPATFSDPRNHATAAASIIELVSKQTDFKPKEQGLDATAWEYQAFFQKLTKFPGFEQLYNNLHYLELTGKLDQLKEQISAYYVPLSGKADAAASAFVEQIPESTKPGSSGTWTLVLITIHGEEDNTISVDLSSVDVKIVVKDDGSVSLKRKQTAKLYQTVVQIDSKYLIANADKLARFTPTEDVETFKEDLTTPSSNDRNKLLKDWLFGSNHACEFESLQSKYVHRRLYPSLQL